MKSEKINISGDRRTLLIAPLDWGLGHATRCIPIIYAFIAQGFEVIIAGDGLIENLLKKEFPDVVFTHLKGYNIQYSNNGKWLPLKLFLQLPKLLRSVYSEHQWLKRITRKNKIDLVVSDNRLGLYHSKIPCIYITHQLKIKTANHFTAWLAQSIHYFFINKYSTCWVPDIELSSGLTGELSHPKILPAIPVKYIGPLSRFQKITTEKKYDLLVLLSGPEPQRTILEVLILKELKTFQGSALLVRGLPSNNESVAPLLKNENNITVANHLSAGALNKAIQQSRSVISRSGYTSIMDLVKLEKKAMLIPTPGQTEQQYLAAYLAQKNIFLSMLQKEFSLEKALLKLEDFSVTAIAIDHERYKKIIGEFIAGI